MSLNPSKVREFIIDTLPISAGSFAKQQVDSLGNISLDKSDSQADFLLPVGSFAKKKSEINLFCAEDVVEDKGRRHSNIYNQISCIMRKRICPGSGVVLDCIDS